MSIIVHILLLHANCFLPNGCALICLLPVYMYIGDHGEPWDAGAEENHDRAEGGMEGEKAPPRLPSSLPPKNKKTIKKGD